MELNEINKFTVVNPMEQELLELAKQSNFEKEIASVINKYSRENMSNTPDYILATYLNSCLNAFEKAIQSKIIHTNS